MEYTNTGFWKWFSNLLAKLYFSQPFRTGNIALRVLGMELNLACSRVYFEMISLKHGSGYFDCGAEYEHYILLSSAESVV